MPFSNIIGHEHLLVLLSRAVGRGTLPPALIFAGPDGVGKRAAAVGVAQALNCLEPRQTELLEREACGVCAACSRIARNVHPDFFLIEPNDKGNITIDPVREVIKRCAYRPFEASWRVVVIDPADAMDEDPQSALLKTLEEPPSRSVFLLVTSMPDALRPTIRSRCPRLRFGRLEPDAIAAALVRDHGFDRAEAAAAAIDADGSIGRALEAQGKDTVEALADARELLAMAARNVDAPRRIAAVKDFFPTRSQPALDRELLSVRLRILGSLIRDLTLLQLGASRDMLANAALEGELTQLARTYPVDRASRGYVAVDRALEALGKNASAKLVADWIAVQL